jgi:RNA polymerase sigma factor (sigma-70 family)
VPASAVQEKPTMQPAANKAYDLDLSKLGDEEVVVLAKECGYQPATQELLVRFRDYTNRLIARQAKQTRLTAADVEDAQQNAVFAVAEAITRYHTEEMVKPNGCSFRTFLRIVLTGRFRDFVKHVTRVARHYDRSVTTNGTGASALDLIEAQAERAGRRIRDRTDPASAAEWREAWERLENVLQRLDTVQRSLWNRLACGTALRTVAQELGISYDKAKRRRQRLLAQLTTQVREPRVVFPAGR